MSARVVTEADVALPPDARMDLAKKTTADAMRLWLRGRPGSSAMTLAEAQGLMELVAYIALCTYPAND